MNYPDKDYSLLEPVGACFPHARLAEAWVPYQSLGLLFQPAIGLDKGTIFPELYRPYVPHPHSPKWY